MDPLIGGRHGWILGADYGQIFAADALGCLDRFVEVAMQLGLGLIGIQPPQRAVPMHWVIDETPHSHAVAGQRLAHTRLSLGRTDAQKIILDSGKTQVGEEAYLVKRIRTSGAMEEEGRFGAHQADMGGIALFPGWFVGHEFPYHRLAVSYRGGRSQHQAHL